EDARAGLEAAGIGLDVRVPPDPVWVLGDAVRLAQVAGNLLTNARKFTDREGRVSVSLTVDGPSALLKVADTGVGIPADELPKVFEAFAQVEETVERSREGLGLGLSLVKALVSLHCGTVRAESGGFRQGTTFTVEIPLDKAG
ncbi:sensor histidine kinase, partial [Zavarzinella formosa]|uniref:sensor histidine kinase n=1 Tax=Zavarzinella formosa TaxID=360055 RepID=UPI001EE68B1F